MASTSSALLADDADDLQHTNQSLSLADEIGPAALADYNEEERNHQREEHR